MSAGPRSLVSLGAGGGTTASHPRSCSSKAPRVAAAARCLLGRAVWGAPAARRSHLLLPIDRRHRASRGRAQGQGKVPEGLSSQPRSMALELCSVPSAAWPGRNLGALPSRPSCRQAIAAVCPASSLLSFPHSHAAPCRGDCAGLERPRSTRTLILRNDLATRPVSPQRSSAQHLGAPHQGVGRSIPDTLEVPVAGLNGALCRGAENS